MEFSGRTELVGCERQDRASWWAQLEHVPAWTLPTRDQASPKGKAPCWGWTYWNGRMLLPEPWKGFIWKVQISLWHFLSTWCFSFFWQHESKRRDALGVASGEIEHSELRAGDCWAGLTWVLLFQSLIFLMESSEEMGHSCSASVHHRFLLLKSLIFLSPHLFFSNLSEVWPSNRFHEL